MAVHEVPSEFKDEEKWLKFFPRRSVLILAVMFGFSIILSKLFSLFKAGGIGFTIGIILTVVAVAMSMIPVSSGYASGCGLTVDKWIMRRIYHKRKHRVVYIKHYTSDIESIRANEVAREELTEEES